MKFEAITFTTKDIAMVMGAIFSAFTFYLKIDSRLNQFEIKMEKIISENNINDVKINARIDALKTSDNTQRVKNREYFAVIPDTRLEVKKKKLFNYKLI
mgnify:FL=1